MLDKVLKDYLKSQNLGGNIDCQSCSHYGLTVYSTNDGAEYAIGTDDQAQEACSEAIESLAWAFRGSFMSDLTGLDATIFDLLSERCESANDAVLSIIKSTCGLDKFVAAAISADGRGHFLAGYDSEETEHLDHFIYRIN